MWSDRIGGGHLVRCVALADELATRGWSVAFAAELSTHMPVPGGIPYRIETMSGSPADEPEALRTSWPDGVDLLIVDHMDRGHAFESSCRPWARRILAIDGLCRRHDCDILLDPVNSTLGGQEEQQVPAACVTLLGPAHALLRPEFARLRPDSLRRRRTDSSIHNILVNFGAFDPHGLTEIALKAIAQACPAAAVRIVLGGSGDRLAQLRQMAATLRLDAIVEGWTFDMASALAVSDIAIGSAGSAAWERCCLGAPGIAVVMADNQRPVAELLARSGAAVVLGEWRGVGAEAIATALRQLLDDRGLRDQLIESAAGLCDGSGAAEVAELATRMAAAPPSRTGE